MDWTVADRIFRTPSPARKRLWLTLSLTTNLGLLAAFKYSAFLATNLNSTFTRFSLPLHLPVPHLLLPIGISFYTFEALSYTIDVYRGKMEPTRSLLDFALFITFFPRMVAGPIMRAELFLPQCAAPRPVPLDEIGQGLTLLLFGLFEKVVLADGVFAPVADAVYAGSGSSPSEAWAGTLGFACQIFFDFAGYSPAPSASPAAWVSACRSTSTPPTRLSISATSGAAGTSASPPGCATTSTSPLAGTVPGRPAPTST